jgi:hypothetical protein
MAARDMGWLSLIDAPSLVVAYARAGSPTFETAAVRWLARLALEGREVGLADVQLAPAALGCLHGQRHEKAQKMLFRLPYLSGERLEHSLSRVYARLRGRWY